MQARRRLLKEYARRPQAVRAPEEPPRPVRIVAKELRTDSQALYLSWPRGRGGIGRRIGLKRNLSARRETGDAELLKFGEP